MTRFCFACLFVTLVFTFCSCSKSEGYADAQVMVINASPDVASVNVSANKVDFLQVLFPNATAYKPVQPGTAALTITKSDSSKNITTLNVPLKQAFAYTVIIADSLKQIKTSVVYDNLTEPAANKAHIRFFQLSPNAGTVRASVFGIDTLVSGNRTFNDQAVAGELTAFSPVTAGKVTLQINRTTPDSVLFSLPAINLEAKKIYTFYLYGIAGASGAQALGLKLVRHN